MSSKSKGRLIIIGGHEQKSSDEERKILKEVAKDAIEKPGGLVIVTVATELPGEVSKEYKEVFKGLGVKEISAIDIRNRSEAEDPKQVEKIKNASVIFFTGGDQLRITSQMGDSLTYHTIQQKLKDGSTVAGTSAGAAAMPETMIIGGDGDTSNEVSGISMAPGLALIEQVIIDSHFAERGRIGRLLGAVTDNPRNLGLGIDENTAIIMEDNERFRVLGSGAVYVVDGASINYSSLSESHPEGIISIFNVTLHVLGEGDCFDLRERRPIVTQKMKEGKGS